MTWLVPGDLLGPEKQAHMYNIKKQKSKMIASFDENWKIIFRSQSKLEIEKRYIQFSSHHIIIDICGTNK
jgi:hypothetical protein